MDLSKKIQEDELARQVREGVRPGDLQGRMKLAGDKLLGNVPMGVDAKNKTTRKVIGGGYELLAVLKFGFLGLMLTLIGALFIWAGFHGAPDYRAAAVGAVLLALGLWCLNRGRQAWRNFSVIRKA